ncbi:hypothetical protein HDV06_003019 [Boothiomyces sp. JEL0866]|nr:hypothetical protein HDV06_003019 [Boothiomyces sp. JEL0866]
MTARNFEQRYGQKLELDPILRKQTHSQNERRRREKFKALIHNLKVLVPKSKSENVQQMAILQNACDYIMKVQEVLRTHGLLAEEDNPVELGMAKFQSEFYVGKTNSDFGSDSSSENGSNAAAENIIYFHLNCVSFSTPHVSGGWAHCAAKFVVFGKRSFICSNQWRIALRISKH